MNTDCNPDEQPEVLGKGHRESVDRSVGRDRQATTDLPRGLAGPTLGALTSATGRPRMELSSRERSRISSLDAERFNHDQRSIDCSALAPAVLLGLLGQEACAQGLADVYKIRDVSSGSHVEYHSIKIPRGSEVVLADLAGPGKVTYWYFTDDTFGKIYPGLVLKAFWDDERPEHRGAPGRLLRCHGRPYHPLPVRALKIEHFCYMCYLPMPFARRARFVLANDGDRDYSQSAAFGFDHENGEDYAREQSRLHYAWRRSKPVKGGVHTLLDVKGRGHYLGKVEIQNQHDNGTPTTTDADDYTSVAF